MLWALISLGFSWCLIHLRVQYRYSVTAAREPLQQPWILLPTLPFSVLQTAAHIRLVALAGLWIVRILKRD